MDISRRRGFKFLVGLASALGAAALMSKVGLMGTGHDSAVGFVLFGLAVLGLDRLLGAVLGMLSVIFLTPHAPTPAQIWMKRRQL